MKFYTLNYDCNTPATQQVNVPTNSDYKIGVKVTKNGKKLPLDLADVTLDGLSADSTMINGYKTFTKSSGDSTGSTESNLNVRLAYEADMKFEKNWHNTSGSTQTQQRLSVALDEDYAGYKITPSDLSIAFLTNKADEITEEQILSSYASVWDWATTRTFNDINEVMNDYKNGVSYWVPNTNKRNQMIAAGKALPDVPFFVGMSATDEFAVYEIELNDQCSMLTPAMNVQNNKYAFVGYRDRLGAPTDVDFKLIETIYKSQVSDIGVAGGSSATTVNLAGTYADGTEFSYDLVTA